MADLLGLSPPVLPTASSLSKSGLQIVNTASSFTVREDGLVPGGIWDDEEERRFYEDLPDLADLVPPTLLGVKEKKEDKKVEAGETTANGKPDNEAEARQRDEEDIRRQLEQLDLEREPEAPAMERLPSAVSDGSGNSIPLADEPAPSTDPVTVAEEDGLQSGPAARLSALFAALPEAVNREMVDKLAVEFAFLNSKAARRRLVKVGTRPDGNINLPSSLEAFPRTVPTFFPTTPALLPLWTSTCPMSVRVFLKS